MRISGQTRSQEQNENNGESAPQSVIPGNDPGSSFLEITGTQYPMADGAEQEDRQCPGLWRGRGGAALAIDRCYTVMVSSSGPSWTREDEEEFRRLLDDLRRDNAERPHAEETGEDAILAERVNRLLVRRRAAQASARRPATATQSGQPSDEALSQIPAETIAAYRQARYEFEWIAIGVDDEHELVPLTLDVPNPYLEALMNMTGRSISAFISAHNPFGRQLSAEENAARHEMLTAEVKRAGFPAFPGRGIDPDGSWPSEASLLILGISREVARQLGARFDQNAIIFADDDFTPRLVLLR